MCVGGGELPPAPTPPGALHGIASGSGSEINVIDERLTKEYLDIGLSEVTEDRSNQEDKEVEERSILDILKASKKVQSCSR